MNRLTVFLTALLCLGASFIYAQERQKVSVEDVWRYYRFYPKSIGSINWMKDGKYYTALVDGKILQYDITTGQVVKTFAGDQPLVPEGESRAIEIEDYELNATEDKILIKTDIEPIYRRSYKAEYFIYDLKDGSLKRLSKNGKQSYATISPDGKKVAFVRDNNLFVVDLASMQEQAITTDGRFNHIINGAADWVYEEEFSFAKAFYWAPDSKKIAFYRFDESEVPEYNMQMWGDLYPKDYRFKYPKAGEKNSVVSIRVYHLDTKETKTIDLGAETDIYVPRVKWTKHPDLLSIRKLNRLQNRLELIHANVATGKQQVVLTETADTYVDIDFNDDLTYLDNGKEFLYSSERSGYKHLYLYDMSGKLKKQITSGNWEVDEVVGIHEKSSKVYFTATKVSSIERHLFVVDWRKGKLTQLTQAAGVHRIDMSPDCSYYIDNYSSAQTPPRYSLHTGNGKEIAVLEDNAQLAKTVSRYAISPKEFFTIKNSEGIELNAWRIKPLNFDETKKYPVLMFVYGGPGSQQVMNQWDSFNFFWYQHLAAEGYMVVCVDNRGTGGRGRDFKHATYKQLGKLEVADQIDAAKYLATLPYVDANRIGIWGWSYGGYMSSLCILLGNDVFKAAIAVAPVTSWRYYDTIYTERYLQRPQDNPGGYDEYSPLTHAARLKGNYLLIHGTGDDNVHFQNAVMMVDALIKANKQFEVFFYPNRNHGIYGGNTRLHLYNLMTDFIKRKL
ncbi:MAG: peptidase S9 [Thermonema sp.]|uniref:S9 family peptidase n=1 Tax=Thermonema sp. TaxID=2231181 RepID=UPI0021DB90A2|nr:S9 family peptidase [Thermonema sp.]GIV39521.1 MAG: peptidase S9 [Thermonema sp.]